MAIRNVPFPKYIDKTKMFGPMEIDEASMILVGLFGSLVVGFMIGANVAASLVGGVVFGAIGAGILRSIKRRYAEGFLWHMAYRKGLYHPVKDAKTAKLKYPEISAKKLKVIPSGYIKTLID